MTEPLAIHPSQPSQGASGALDTSSLRHVWNQRAIPVVLRRNGKGELLRVRLPYADDNRRFLKNDRTLDPIWRDALDRRYWELPKAWFNDFVDRALKRYGQVYVIQPYRSQEKCAPACLNARGHECECSCMGANHGMGNDGSWFVVSETFCTRWGERELACRLLTKRRDQVT